MTAITVALALVTSAFAFGASSAWALKPTGDYVNFGDCPLGNLAVNVCIFAQTSSGQFTIGKTEVPINKTITLQGGIIAETKAPFAQTFVAATDGNTLTKVPLVVPGGLLKIVAPTLWPKWLQEIFNEFFSKGLLEVTATTELVGNVGINTNNLTNGEGTALLLPTRIHLQNLFLGSECYVGSSGKPVNVEFTTGTTSPPGPPTPNEPISGAIGEVEVKDGGALVVINKNSLVNNTFSAPGAEGCGGSFSSLIDPVVDAELGLPSASGYNTAILNGKLESAAAAAVKASEK